MGFIGFCSAVAGAIGFDVGVTTAARAATGAGAEDTVTGFAICLTSTGFEGVGAGSLAASTGLACTGLVSVGATTAGFAGLEVFSGIDALETAGMEETRSENVPTLGPKNPVMFLDTADIATRTNTRAPPNTSGLTPI